jgi:hypothetical protein
MDEQKLKERMRDIRNQMDVIEWDMSHTKSMAKSHIYEQLREEYEGMEKSLRQEN